MAGEKKGLRTAGGWKSGLSDWVASLPDLMVATEPLWVIPALAMTCMTLLWGLGGSWIGLVIAAGALPLRRWRLGHVNRWKAFEIPMALLLAASLVGMIVSPDRALSLRAFQSVVACMLLFYSLANMPHSGYIKWGFAVAGVGVLLASLLAFREGFAPPTALGDFGNWIRDQVQRLPLLGRPAPVANPIFSAAHGLSIALEMVLLPVVGLLVFTRKVSSRLAAVVAGLPFLSLLFLLGSQAAWLSVSVGVAVLLIWRSRWAALPLAVIVGLGYVVYQQGWLDPHSFFSQFGPAESLNARTELWKGAMEVIRHHPVAGCGLGCLGKFSTTTLLSPHSAYIQFYADTGLIGALSLLGALIAGGRMAVDLAKAPRDDPWYGFAVGVLAAAAAVAVHGLFEGSPAGIIAETSDGYLYIVSPVVAILAGLLVKTRRLMEESTPKTPAYVLLELSTETVL